MKIAAISIADYAEATEGMPHDAERLFFRMLLKMYSREDGLPDDDAENARMFGYDTRRYKRLKKILLEFPCGLFLAGDEIRNSRIDAELPLIAERKKKLREAGRKGGQSNGAKREVEAKSDGSPIEVEEKSERSRGEVEAKSDRSPIASHIPQQAKSTTYGNPSPSPSPSPLKKESMHASFLEDLMEEIWQATAGCMMDDFQDVAIVKSWLSAGADPQADIVATIRQKAIELRADSIEHYGYFNGAVREAIADRKAGQPNRHTVNQRETPEQYMARRMAEEMAAGTIVRIENHAAS